MKKMRIVIEFDIATGECNVQGDLQVKSAALAVILQAATMVNQMAEKPKIAVPPKPGIAAKPIFEVAH